MTPVIPVGLVDPENRVSLQLGPLLYPMGGRDLRRKCLPVSGASPSGRGDQWSRRS